MKKHIVVIGGGIAGTAAAYTLQKKGYDVTIVEKNDRLGGRILSITKDNFTFELGAGFLTDIYTNIFTFLKENGLDTSLQKRKSKSAILKNNKIYHLSAATLLGNSFVSFSAKTKLLPEFLKILLNWNNFDMHVLWRGYPYDKKTVKDFFTGKSGRDLVDYLLQPMLDGYLYWSADKTSEAMLLFILKFLAGRRYIYPPGLQSIPELLAKNCHVVLSQEIKEIKKLSQHTYEIQTNQKIFKADAVVCATTASAVPKLFKNLSHKQKEFFSSVSYSSTAVVAKTYKDKTLPTNYGIAYPRVDGRNLGTITIVFDKVTNTTLVKLFASGATGKKLCLDSDNKIESALLKDAMISREFFDFSLSSSSTHIQRWHEALPEFNVGHFKRLKAFKEGEIESKDEKIVFAGDYIGGPFMEGAFTSGVQAAERLSRLLS